MSANENLPPLPTGTHGSLVDDWKRVYTADQMRDYALAAIAAHERQPEFLGLKQPEPAFRLYVQEVPDHCDRIIWRGEYRSILHMPGDSPWLPIDGAPKDGTSVLVLAGGDPTVAWYWENEFLDGGGQWNGYQQIEHEVTHYMPIPPLPKVKP